MRTLVVQAVIQRAASCCEKCGLPFGQEFALHHRRLRSQGGKDEPANLLAVHHSCHNLVTESIHLNPRKAVEAGWIVPSWADPEEWPLVTPGGNNVRLCNDGSVETTETE